MPLPEGRKSTSSSHGKRRKFYTFVLVNLFSQNSESNGFTKSAWFSNFYNVWFFSVSDSSLTSKSLGSVEKKIRRDKENKHAKIEKEKKTDRIQTQTEAETRQTAKDSSIEKSSTLAHEVKKTSKTKDVIQKSKLFHCL